MYEYLHLSPKYTVIAVNTIRWCGAPQPTPVRGRAAPDRVAGLDEFSGDPGARPTGGGPPGSQRILAVQSDAVGADAATERRPVGLYRKPLHGRRRARAAGDELRGRHTKHRRPTAAQPRCGAGQPETGSEQPDGRPVRLRSVHSRTHPRQRQLRWERRPSGSLEGERVGQ